MPADPTSPATSTPTRLLVARHGESEWNAIGRWQGHADPPLSARGRGQAAFAATQLADTFDAVWASDLQRAATTARIIANSIGIAEVALDPRLRETDVGPWQGLTAAEIEQGWPGHLAEHRLPEGFEAYDRAARRFIDGLIGVAAAHPGETVFVVAHGGVIRSARWVLGAPDGEMPNLAASWFTVTGHHVEPGELVRLADPEPTTSAAL